MNETENDYAVPVAIAEPESGEILIPVMEEELDPRTEMLLGREAKRPYELVTRRTNIINLRFAYFLIAIQLDDEERQRQEYTHLLWLIGRTGDYEAEWKSIAGLCITKEISKHSHLDIPTIIASANQNSFAYLWIAGKRDFANARQS